MMSIYQVDFALDISGVSAASFNVTAYVDAIHLATGLEKRSVSILDVQDISLRHRAARRRVLMQVRGVRIYTSIVVNRVSHPEVGALAEAIVATTQSGTMTQAMVASGLASVAAVGVAGIATVSAGRSIADPPVLPAASYASDGTIVPRSSQYTSLAIVPPSTESDADYVENLPWLIGVGGGCIVLALLALFFLATPRGHVLFADAVNTPANTVASHSHLVVRPKRRKQTKSSAVAPAANHFPAASSSAAAMASPRAVQVRPRPANRL